MEQKSLAFTEKKGDTQTDRDRHETSLAKYWDQPPQTTKHADTQTHANHTLKHASLFIMYRFSSFWDRRIYTM